MTRPTRISALIAALALTVAGVAALALHATPAGASQLAKVPADFSVAPGDVTSKDFADPKVGSAEVRPNPTDCRDNPAIALTCGVHRIKLRNRTPGYFLRISTSWTAREALATSVPDVDTYLFDTPDSQFDYHQVGGVSGAIPETIKLVDPKQDEYDLVIGAYAGAITGYTVAVEYTNAPSTPTPGIAPDLSIAPHQPPVTKKITSALAVPTIEGQKPDSCRNDPSQDLVCDAYRLKLKRNLTKEATNFVVVTLDWDPVVTPDVVLPAGGVGGEQVPNLDMYVFDTATHLLEGVAANLFDSPERAAFVATQDEYDIVIQSKRGVSTGYTLSALMTDEIFGKPFELLDPLTGQPIGSAPVGERDFAALLPNSPAVPPLSLAPIDIDDQIAGIGLDTTQEFDVQEAIRLGQEALRNTAVTSEPPSGFVLFVALLLVPVALLAGGVVVMRRRHNVLI